MQAARVPRLGKRFILVYGSQRIAHLHVDIAVGIGCMSHPGRFFWDRKLVLGVQCHLPAPSCKWLLRHFLGFLSYHTLKIQRFPNSVLFGDVNSI